MPLGIVLLIVSLVISIFLLTSVNNFMGIRYIGNAFGSHIVISDIGFSTIWIIAIALFGAGIWNILEDIKGNDKKAIGSSDQKNVLSVQKPSNLKRVFVNIVDMSMMAKN